MTRCQDFKWEYLSEIKMFKGSFSKVPTHVLAPQKAAKYTIILEAKDHGEEIQLSSTCEVIVTIEDGNNHLPFFTGQTVSKHFFLQV